MLGRSDSVALTSLGPTNTAARTRQLFNDKEIESVGNEAVLEFMLLFFQGLGWFRCWHTITQMLNE
jgi:hypothetical protein